MKLDTTELGSVINRRRRAEGQLAGVIRMLEAGARTSSTSSHPSPVPSTKPASPSSRPNYSAARVDSGASNPEQLAGGVVTTAARGTTAGDMAKDLLCWRTSLKHSARRASRPSSYLVSTAYRIIRDHPRHLGVDQILDRVGDGRLEVHSFTQSGSIVMRTIWSNSPRTPASQPPNTSAGVTLRDASRRTRHAGSGPLG